MTRHHSTAVRHRNLLAAAGVLVSLGLLTACSDSDDGATSAKPSVTAAPSTSSTPTKDPQEADKKAALAVYDSFLTEQAKAYRKASAKGTDLEKYASLDALSKVEVDLANMKKAGTVVRGELGHEPDAKLDSKAETPTATIKDCVDLSKYRMYDTKAKKVKPLPPEQPLKYITTAKVERWDGGRWMVTDINPQGGAEC
ncbi:hypothetical protein [Streptomyces lasiicapitis]|uniref:Secreted protein/lipoprotein n=1 Tax=Streptomyces lasiicapitis TaxID=1923961 RepID=A0ABQ2MX23_9ACTN|nr:hypothetical protein [Streptomyces lasiicapitis]GGO59005.1 hypothetical protein GCM10012286_79610 [Streptomyces lasiicapitis]